MLMITERAAELIDADGLKALAQPLSEPGRDVRASHRPFAASDEAAWRADRAECHALVQALAQTPELSTELERTLARVERLGESTERILDATAAVADLFRAKAMLHAAWSLARSLTAAGVLRPCSRLPLSEHELESALRVLNPEPELRARFSLSDRFSSALAAARVESAEAETAHSGARETAVAALESKFGVKLRAGKVTVAAGNSHALDSAAELTLVASTGFERIYEPVWAGELPELKRAADIARQRVQMEEATVVQEICGALEETAKRLPDLQRWLGSIDFGFARVRLAERFGAWPTPGTSLCIVEGWVPRSRRQVESSGGTYQPTTFQADRGVTLLSGPNMGGKTVALTLAGTVQFLAQLGYPVPAASATFRWVAGIDYVGGELSEVTSGLSSFAGEMAALREVLERGETSLVLLDELGRSTAPNEGAAIAEAAVHALCEADHVAIIVSHFARLRSADRVRALRVAGIAGVTREELDAAVAEQGWQAALNSVMDFALNEDDGSAQASDALRIASAMGVPKSLIDRAANTIDRNDS